MFSLVCLRARVCLFVCVCEWGILIIQTSSMCSDSDVSVDGNSDSDASSSFHARVLPFSLPTRRCFMCSSSSSAFLLALLILLLVAATVLLFVVLLLLLLPLLLKFFISFIRGVVAFIAKNPQVQTSRLFFFFFFLLLLFAVCDLCVMAFAEISEQH